MLLLVFNPRPPLATPLLSRRAMRAIVGGSKRPSPPPSLVFLSPCSQGRERRSPPSLFVLVVGVAASGDVQAWENLATLPQLLAEPSVDPLGDVPWREPL